MVVFDEVTGNVLPEATPLPHENDVAPQQDTQTDQARWMLSHLEQRQARLYAD